MRWAELANPSLLFDPRHISEFRRKFQGLTWNTSMSKWRKLLRYGSWTQVRAKAVVIGYLVYQRGGRTSCIKSTTAKRNNLQLWILVSSKLATGFRLACGYAATKHIGTHHWWPNICIWMPRCPQFSGAWTPEQRFQPQTYPMNQEILAGFSKDALMASLCLHMTEKYITP